VGGVGALAADKLLFVGLYPAFHAGLELGAALTLTASLLLLRLVRPLSASLWVSQALKVGTALALLLSAIPALTLSAKDDSRVYALEQSGWLSGALTRVRALTDWDSDGYSSWYGGGDCAPYDNAINPGAREVPNNGVDDNCRAGDLSLITQDFTRAPMPTTPAPQSVVLITVDTTRPDHLSAYGYERDTTPNIKAWAERGVRFDRAYSTSAWTSVAMSSLMRGLYPSHLQWTRVYETSKYRLVRLKETFNLQSGERVRLSFTLPLDDPREPLAATLKARGLHTMAVVDDGYGEFLSPKVGTGEGFDHFRLVDKLPRKRRNDEGAIDLALESLKARPEGEPFFLWVHLFGPHDPNHTHKGLKRFGRDLKAKYDHELLFMDQQVGRLLKKLDEIEEQEQEQGRGLTVALTSDHGELFMGRRRYHGVDLHEQSIRVPMIIVGEGWPSGVVSQAPVSLVDLSPTLLAAADAPAPHPLDGLNLKPLITEGLNPQRLLFAETWYITPEGKIVRDYAAAFDGAWKAIYQRDKQLMTVERQDELKRPAKNWGRKEPQAGRVVEGLERYLEASSNDRGATEEQPPAEALRKVKRAPKRKSKPKHK
jgi:arylsulfatase A-like enzyme